MKNKLIKVIVKEPKKKPKGTEIVNSLRALQDTVGGYIEAVGLADDCAVICDEEGRIKGKSHNCYIKGVSFVGSIIIVGVDDGDFSDVPQWIIDDVFGSNEYEKTST